MPRLRKIDAVLFGLPQVFEWARAVEPQQPLTSAVWVGNNVTVAAAQLRNSDVVSFHDYGASPPPRKNNPRWERISPEESLPRHHRCLAAVSMPAAPQFFHVVYAIDPASVCAAAHKIMGPVRASRAPPIRPRGCVIPASSRTILRSLARRQRGGVLRDGGRAADPRPAADLYRVPRAAHQQHPANGHAPRQGVVPPAHTRPLIKPNSSR